MIRRSVYVKVVIFTLVMSFFTAAIVIVFAQVRFEDGKTVKAEFVDASGLKEGEFVRIAGVEVGKVKSVTITKDSHALVEFTTKDGVALTSQVHAAIRYQNLVGDRYLELLNEGGDTPIAPGNVTVIPISRTTPALDLDALIGGFRPLFKALDPAQVNRLSSSLVQVFQGQGGTIADLLAQTDQLTNALANRDQLIGSVITNLNNVLTTVNQHTSDFDATITRLQTLVSGLGARSQSIANGLQSVNQLADVGQRFLGESRPIIKNDLTQVGRVSDLVQSDYKNVDQTLTDLPLNYRKLSRLGLYGDFFNFFFCDLQLKVNGPKGDPVYVKFFAKPVGRCSP